jgi:hypothetical protein
MCCFWRIFLCVYDSKISDYKGTVLAANLDKLVIGDIARLMRSLSQETKIFGTTVEKIVSKDGLDS